MQLFAAADDPEDGILSDDAVVWTLDGQALATGMDPLVLIEAGSYVLGVTAPIRRDSPSVTRRPSM